MEVFQSDGTSLSAGSRLSQFLSSELLVACFWNCVSECADTILRWRTHSSVHLIFGEVYVRASVEECVEIEVHTDRVAFSVLCIASLVRFANLGPVVIYSLLRGFLQVDVVTNFTREDRKRGFWYPHFK